MPEQNRTSPIEITNALAALDQLRAECPGVDVSELTKTLPPLARKLALNKHDFSIDALLVHAHQGTDHVRDLYASLDGIQKNKPQKTYEDIVANLIPDERKNFHGFFSRTEVIRKRDKDPDHPLPYAPHTSPADWPTDEHRLWDITNKAAKHEDMQTLHHIMGTNPPQYVMNAALVHAAIYARENAMRLLINHGADVNATSYISGQAQNLLAHCCALDLRQSAKILIEHEAIITAEAFKALKNLPEILSFIEERGADLTLMDTEATERLNWYKEWIKASPHLSHEAIREKFNLPDDAITTGIFTELNPKSKNDRTAANIMLMMVREIQASSTTEIAKNAINLFGTEDKVLRYLERWGTPGKQPLHDILHMISMPKNHEIEEFNTPDLKAWGDAALQHGPEMARLVKFSYHLPKPCRSDDGSCWSLIKTRNAIASLAYRRGQEHPELAIMAMAIHWTEYVFNTALSIIQDYQDKYAANNNKKPGNAIPDITIDGAAFDKDGYTFSRLPDGDIRGLALGDFTDCCQHIGGHGDKYTRHGFLSPKAGFYAVTNNRTDQIVAQSWAWRGTHGELVLDSLEYLNGHITTEQATKLCHIFAQKARKAGVTQAIHIGQGGKTPAGMGFNNARHTATPADPITHDDSRRQFVIAGPL